MLNATWEDFRQELALWRRAGNLVEFWWRDDDAGQSTPRVSRLLNLSAQMEVPLALAVIPDRVDPAVFAQLDAEVSVIQHGSDHMNRAAPPAKKTEFPDVEPVDDALHRLAEGRRKLEDAAGDLFVPVLAPPWNRLAPALVSRLAGAGYVGLSRFNVRNVTDSFGGLVETNTHVDIIDWKGKRGFCGLERALGQAVRHLAARRAGTVDASEPTGWLTHHAVHDEACWKFLADLFDATRAVEGVEWRSSVELFERRSRTRSS